MTSTDLTWFGVIMTIIGFAFLYQIIKPATKSEITKKYLEIQIKLLIEIAKAQGVSDDKLKEITTV